ncbi:MAG: hypothetical protein JNL67_13260 [Planctomycetaceae bacterium]|nr:hypothetical protein [Planctomycetaceae bacterium]
MKNLNSFAAVIGALAVALGLGLANGGLVQDTATVAPSQALPGQTASSPIGATVNAADNRYDDPSTTPGGQQPAAAPNVAGYPFGFATSSTQGIDVTNPSSSARRAWLHSYGTGNPQTNEALNAALATWREARDESAKQEAKGQANAALASIYDELLDGQEKEIGELEQRVVALREQLKRRREAKAKMVELKLEMLLSQTDGLGWPSGDSNQFFGTIGTPLLLPNSNPRYRQDSVAPAAAADLRQPR